MSPIDLWQLLGAIFPRVENPLPETIGLMFPVMLGAAGQMLGVVLSVDRPKAQRDRLIGMLTVAGFSAGLGLYIFALVNQLTFGI